MNLVARWLVAIVLVLGSASSWAQISYFTLIDTDNNTATGCTVALPTAGTVPGIERRLTATVSENAAPQVTQLSLESCVGSSFGAPVALPGTPYPVGLNNGVGGGDVIEQAAPADAVAPPGPPVRLYFAAQGRTSDDLLGSAGGGAPILFDLWPTGGSVGIPTLSEWGLLGLILLLLAAVVRQRSRLPGSMVAVLLVGMLTGIVWAAGFLLDGQVNDWQGVPAVGTDATGDSASNTTDILAAFAAREGGNAFFRIDAANVQTPNQAPSFTKGLDQTVDEDVGAQTVNGWATAIDDSDPGAVQALTFQVTNNTNPSLFSAGPAVDATTGNLTYTPAANANGSATITLVLKDDGGTAIGGVDTSAPQTFDINVTAVNDAPSFTKGPDQTVLEDAGAQTVNSWATALSTGPADEASQTLIFNITGNTNAPLFSAGPAVDATTGTLTYTPAAGASGSATITVTLSDTGSNTPPNVNTSAAQTFLITVTAVDDPPVAVNDPATVAEDAPATAIDVLTNDTDPDGGPKSIASVTQPANGTVVITGGGTGLTYQPNANYCNDPPGTTLDTFTYILTPGGSTANVTVTVTCVDDAPAVDLNGPAAGIDFAATFTEGGGAVAIVDATQLTVADLDSPNLASATVTLTNLLDAGVETLLANVAGTSITANYVAATGVLTLTGPDTVANFQTVLRTVTYNNASANPNATNRVITIVVNDGASNSPTATSTVTVNAINSAPSFTKGADPTVDEDAGAQTVNGWATDISAGPADESAQTLIFNITNNTNPGLFSAGPAVDTTTGNLTYTPAANANGTATITVTLSDDGSNTPPNVNTSAPQNFTITVDPINDAPSFTKGLNQTVLEDAGAQTVNGWATDISAGPADESAQTLIFNITNNTNPGLFSAGPAVDTTTGNLTYTPTAGASGSATITVTLSDSGSGVAPNVNTSAAQTFLITVTAVDDPPVAVNDPATVAEDAPATAIDVLTNDTDPDGGPKSIASVTQPTNGTVVNNTTNVTYQPNADYCNAPPGTTLDTFTYTLTPGSSTATVTVTVTCVDDPPAAVDDPATVDEDSGVNTINVLANDTDPDAGPKLINSVTQPTNGTVVITNGGADLTYQPNANYCNNPPGTTLDTFTYTLTPGSSTATVSVTVNCLNDAPVIALPGPTVAYDTVTPVILDATATVIDIDSPNFDTGVLAANVTTNCENDDRIGVRDQGAGVGNISVSGLTVRYDFGSGPVAIGTIATEFNCATPAVPTLAITLNATADLTATQALLRNLTYFSAVASPTGTTRTVAVVLTDGDGGTSNTATKTVNIDAAPEVQNINPANNATGVPINANVLITFSENVTAPAAAFDITCATSGNHPFAIGGGPTSFTLDPTDFANGEVCTVTVTATQVADQDSNDPPDNMAANFTSTFTTVDAAPRVTSTTPTASATVGTGQTVTLNFSESVDIAAGGITWNCGGAIAFSPALPQTGVTTLTLTPGSALPEGATCTVVLESTLITDVDSVDPPNQLDGNGDSDTTDGDADDFTLGFTVDTAPTFVSSTPANGNVNVNVANNLGVGFSEAVNVSSPASFTLDCGGGSLGYTISSGNGTNLIVLDPSANLPGGTICTVTINGGSVSDMDTADPPNVMASSPSFSFTTQSLAEDDAYTVTPHLTLAVDTGIQSGRVTANDQLGVGSITSFGFAPSCTGTAPGAQLDAGAANGRLTLNLNGSFSYEPPAGLNALTRTFCYTVTGGDTANVTFSILNQPRTWFINATAAAGGNGTQARPFNTLTGAGSFNAVAADGDGDTLYLEGNHTCGLTLRPSQGVIGGGSSQNLATFTAITPVTGSAFPTLSGTRPLLTAAADCLTLGSNNTLRGFNFGNVGAANNALVGSGIGTLTVNDAAIATNGQALNLSNGTFNATFDSVSSSGGTFNVRLNSIAGTVDLGSGALTGAGSGVAFVVSGFSPASNTVAITYGGSITAAKSIDIQTHSSGDITLSGALSSTSGNTGINIANNTSGTITLSGASKVVTSGANPAVTLSNNTGATINFTGGGLAISTTGGNGFSATGGGTVNVTGSGNTITSGSGTALNVANTTIGASGLTFQSIASNGGSNTGIILDTTGSSGGLTVTGTGSAGSGGTVANKAGANGSVVTGVGVYLNNTGPVSLSRMQMNDFQNFAILGNIVASFVLRDSVINGVSGTLGAGNAGTNPTSRESVIFITDLSGTSGILNSTISGGATDNIRFIKNSGTLNLTITGNTIQNNDNTNGGIGEDGLFISTEGGSSLFANIANNTFANHHGDHVSASGNGTSQLHVTINNNGMTADGGVTEDFDNNGTFGDDLGGTILVADNESADVFFDVSNNTMFGAVVTAITINQSAFTTAAASLSGRVQNNTIGNAAITDSGSSQGSGIAIDAQGASAGAGLYKIIISAADNDVFEYNNHGILLASGDGSSALAATVTSNIINNPGTFGANGIHLNHGKTSTPAGGGGADSQTGCFDIRTNNIVGAGNAGAGSTDFRLRQRINTTVQLVGYTGSASDTAAVIAYVQGLNTGAETGQATVSGTGGGFINTPSGVNCPSPTLPTLPSAP
ncbi:MAG: tandem-95 repeat protein [Candidatus Contendobacter sp.]|nr:tandem-95 repeat protein [Candidatus Contendobacter sp.]